MVFLRRRSLKTWLTLAVLGTPNWGTPSTPSTEIAVKSTAQQHSASRLGIASQNSQFQLSIVRNYSFLRTILASAGSPRVLRVENLEPPMRNQEESQVGCASGTIVYAIFPARYRKQHGFHHFLVTFFALFC